MSKGGRIFSRRRRPSSLRRKSRSSWACSGRAPVEVVLRLLLRLDVDLMWDGGIGTYVKASHQSHADAGNPTNDSFRVNANGSTKVVGEGNLGFTPAARWSSRCWVVASTRTSSTIPVVSICPTTRSTSRPAQPDGHRWVMTLDERNVLESLPRSCRRRTGQQRPARSSSRSTTSGRRSTRSPSRAPSTGSAARAACHEPR